MTPAARIAAAIEILDDWLAGAAPEQVLTTWARQNRFAGSKDRAAIRDHVYDALRCRGSYAAMGGGLTGRGLMIGALRAGGTDPAALFTGEGYGPAPLSPEEAALDAADPGPRADMPEWLLPQLEASLGDDLDPVCALMRARAPVFLRANLARASRDEAQAALTSEGIATAPHPLATSALEVTENPRKVAGSSAYRDGLVELQDAASQAILGALPVTPGLRVLDYCAGGGGKALALAAMGAEVTAHDIDAGRMRDLPERARRAGARIDIAAPGEAAGAYDLILADAPCSGSGAWRRSPQGKWDLTAGRLDELCRIQASILDEISGMAGPGTRLAYATCSLLDAENSAQVAAFLARTPGWHLEAETRLTPLDGGDGFYLAQLSRD